MFKITKIGGGNNEGQAEAGKLSCTSSKILFVIKHYQGAQNTLFEFELGQVMQIITKLANKGMMTF